MIKVTSRLMVATAAATMAFAPIAAQANTRAGDNAPVYTTETAAQPGLARDAEGEGLRGTPGIIIALLAAAAAIAGIVAVADNNDNGQSPGT
jgi:hypothetical protein